MPRSSVYLIPAVLYVMGELKPKRICDIGIGCGKYGMLFRELLDINNELEDHSTGSIFKRDLRLDGVEVYPNYLGPIQEAIYDNILIGDIRDLAEQLPDYDLFVMIDIIEHMDIASGTKLLETLRSKSRYGVFIVTPIDPIEQEPLLGNECEAHVSVWGKKQWNMLATTRYTIVGNKWLVLVEGKETGIATWLRMPSLKRRCKLAYLRAVNALFPGTYGWVLGQY